MFVGIEENGTSFDAENETANNNVKNTKEVIYDFLQRELSFENAQSGFEFQRIHRVGKRTEHAEGTLSTKKGTNEETSKRKTSRQHSLSQQEVSGQNYL